MAISGNAKGRIVCIIHPGLGAPFTGVYLISLQFDLNHLGSINQSTPKDYSVTLFLVTAHITAISINENGPVSFIGTGLLLRHFFSTSLTTQPV